MVNYQSIYNYFVILDNLYIYLPFIYVINNYMYFVGKNRGNPDDDLIKFKKKSSINDIPYPLKTFNLLLTGLRSILYQYLCNIFYFNDMFLSITSSC